MSINGSGTPVRIDNEVDVLIIAGQSNCLGAVNVSQMPAKYQGPRDKVQIWFEGWQNDPTYGRFVPIEPTRNTTQRAYTSPGNGSIVIGWGFEQECSMLMQLRENKRVYVIKNPINGARIVRWSNGQDGRINLTRYLQEAITWFKVRGIVPNFRGFAWIQGESDAEDGMSTATYQGHLEALIDHVRGIDPLLSTVRVIMSKLNFQTGIISNRDAINQAYTNVLSSRTNCVLMDGSTISATSHDNLHYNAASIETMGGLLYTHLQY